MRRGNYVWAFAMSGFVGFVTYQGYQAGGWPAVLAVAMAAATAWAITFVHYRVRRYLDQQQIALLERTNRALHNTLEEGGQIHYSYGNVSMLSPRSSEVRYRQDVLFYTLVNQMGVALRLGTYTPATLREAACFAATVHEREARRPK